MCPHFFRWIFLHEKRGLVVQNLLTFPNSLKTVRKWKNGFSQYFWWFLSCGHIVLTPHSSYSQKPRTIRVPGKGWKGIEKFSSMINIFCFLVYDWNGSSVPSCDHDDVDNDCFEAQNCFDEILFQQIASWVNRWNVECRSIKIHDIVIVNKSYKSLTLMVRPLKRKRRGPFKPLCLWTAKSIK